MIADGTAGYVYNTATGTFSTISGGGFPAGGAAALTYIDGYFIASEEGSMTVCASDLYDGTVWNALAASPVSAAPDAVQALSNLAQQLWIIKEYTSEVWYDAAVPTSQGFPVYALAGHGCLITARRRPIRSRAAATRSSSWLTRGTTTAASSWRSRPLRIHAADRKPAADHIQDGPLPDAL